MPHSKRLHPPGLHAAPFSVVQFSAFPSHSNTTQPLFSYREGDTVVVVSPSRFSKLFYVECDSFDKAHQQTHAQTTRGNYSCRGPQSLHLHVDGRRRCVLSNRTNCGSMAQTLLPGGRDYEAPKATATAMMMMMMIKVDQKMTSSACKLSQKAACVPTAN